jgi:hypothetical protein
VTPAHAGEPAVTNRPDLPPTPSASSWPTRPPVVTLCRHCPAEADEDHPPGWSTENVTKWLRMSFRYGVCPACRSAPPAEG